MKAIVARIARMVMTIMSSMRVKAEDFEGFIERVERGIKKDLSYRDIVGEMGRKSK